MYSYQSQAQVFQKQNMLLMVEINNIKEQMKTVQAEFDRTRLEVTTLRKDRDGLVERLREQGAQHNLVTLMSSTVSNDPMAKLNTVKT